MIESQRSVSLLSVENRIYRKIIDLRAEYFLTDFRKGFLTARLNSIEYAQRLTATDSKLAQSPLFKFSRHKEGIRTKSHSEILAAKACQARFPSAFIRVEKKEWRERSKEREINEAHDKQRKRDRRSRLAKNLPNKIPAIPA